MSREARRLLSACVVGLALASCDADRSEVIGSWRNGSGQILIVDEDLNGTLSQARACVPPLNIYAKRDPFDGHSIRFVPNQPVYFNEQQRQSFDRDFFCASDKSVPMCAFCVAEDDQLICKPTEQGIAGYGTKVTYDCSFSRTSTGTTTSTCSMPQPTSTSTTCRPMTVDDDQGEV